MADLAFIPLLLLDFVLQEVLFEEKGANSVAWNSHFEDMLCFSGNGQLFIKTGDFPLHVQKMQGFVVGFKVSKMQCSSSCQIYDISLGQPCLRLTGHDMSS